MLALYVVFIIYMVLPALSGGLILAATKHGLITTTHGNRLTGKAKSLKPETYAAGAVLVSISVLIIIAGYNGAGGRAAGWIVGTVFTSVVSSTLVLAVIMLRASTIYELSPATFKWIGSLIALLLVYISSVYADAFIANELGIVGTEINAAQRALTILFLPFVCAFALSWTLLPIYAVAGILWIWHVFTDETKEQQRLRFFMLGDKNSPLRTNKAEIYMVLFVSLAFATLIPLNAVDIATKDYATDRQANKAIVWASFHLDNHSCFPNAHKGTRFALIDAKRVAAASPDEKLAYTYKVKSCDQP
ncbi:hypothetical protein [Pseudomonas fulva]|uniref:Uncharacterized protein n=1 Tax=Pseudomonas fulva (strain 12-X) TaxID=743720 RepID=F6AIF9_PSEF1|nr:hypothetical protein [Pseudomonas fulva]AEF20547.1 hypothetical protein Psefu_0565 [Pseudomonas fulva 12-X]